MSKRYPYLLYPLIFMFPPVHEIGHVFIAWIFNVKIIVLDYAKVTYDNTGSSVHWQLQGLWDMPIFYILFVTAITGLFLSAYYYLKDYGIDLRYILKVKFNRHPRQREEVRL